MRFSSNMLHFQNRINYFLSQTHKNRAGVTNDPEISTSKKQILLQWIDFYEKAILELAQEINKATVANLDASIDSVEDNVIEMTNLLSQINKQHLLNFHNWAK